MHTDYKHIYWKPENFIWIELFTKNEERLNLHVMSGHVDPNTIKGLRKLKIKEES